MRPDSATPSDPSTRPTTRRRALTMLGAGAVAALFSRERARASDGEPTYLRLGEYNTVPPDASLGTTLLDANVPGRALDVRNSATAQNSGGVEAWSHGGGPAVQANSFGPGAPGVIGASHDASAWPGQFGTGSGTGVTGVSGTGAGVSGHSASGVGGSFSVGSSSGKGLQVDGPSSMTAGILAPQGDTLFIENSSTGEDGGGAISAISRGDQVHAIEGMADGPRGVGVFGLSGADPHRGQGSGTGVQGESASGTGVVGASSSGVGVRAQAYTPDATALSVDGRARFSTAGAAEIPGGSSSVTVPNPAVTDASHVTVTLTGDPGASQVTWVQLDPGTGFTVHLSAEVKKKGGLPLTYLVVEQG
jgi:predicted outer membrane repeat protein